MLLYYLGDPNYSVADAIVDGFKEEIDGYLYSRFGD